MGLIVSLLLFYSVSLRVIFMVFSDIKLRRDKWTMMDTILSIQGIVSYSIISTLTIEDILYQSNKKLYWDWINCFLIIIAWYRIWIYVLLIPTFSFLLNTFRKMVESSIFFNFIILGLLLFFAVILYDLYSWQDRNRFRTFLFTVRTLFDGLTGNYSISTYVYNQLFYMFIFSLFILMSNVVILNYLVAIISLEYQRNIPKGKFGFLWFKYQYIEKYSLPLKDKWGYQELIIHPFPLNILCIPVLFFVFNKQLMKKVSLLYSRVIFWVENIVIITIFQIYEFLLVFILYIKTFTRLSKANSIQEFTKLIIVWSIIGIPVLAFTSFADTIRLIKILRANADPNSKENNSQDLDNAKKSKIVIFSEVLETLKLIRDIMGK